MARHRKKDPAALVCTLAVVFAVTAATCLLVLLGGEKEASPPPEGDSLSQPWAPGAREGRLPGSTGPEGDEDTFRYQLNGTPTFQKDGTGGNLLIENTPGNLYPMEVLYLLDETGETVCQSGLLPPGSFLEEGSLSQPLEPGEYPDRAVVVVYEEPQGEELARFEEGITLVVSH